MKECREERTAFQIFDFAQLLAALPVLVDEMLICILQFKILYMPLQVLKTKIEVFLSIKHFFILMAE